jgi:hypothetical protein
MQLEVLVKSKIFSGLIGIRSYDLPACSITPQPSTLPRAPSQTIPYFYYAYSDNAFQFGFVGIATGYGLDDRGVGARVTVGSRIVTSPSRPDQIWDLPSLLSNGYRGLFPRG